MTMRYRPRDFQEGRAAMKMENIVRKAEISAEDIIPKTLHFIWVGDESKRPDNGSSLPRLFITQ